MEFLVIVGSLRRDSYNSVLARAAVELLPGGVTATVLEGVDLPNYSEDVDAAGAPDVVTSFRERVAGADGVVFVTPEYNALPSGSVKNAIDWGSRPYGEAALSGKAVGVLGASGSPNGARWAQEAVVRAATIAGATVHEAPPVPVGPHYEKLVDGALVDPELRQRVREYLAGLVAMARERVPVAS